MSADIAGSRRDRTAMLEVRELGPESAEAACDVMHRAFARHLNDGVGTGALHETPSILRADLASGTKLTGLFLRGRLAAIVKSRPAEDGTLYFARLAVAPEAQGTGCAQALIRYLRQRASNEGLDGLSCTVRASSQGNIAMYEHMGFRVSGRRMLDSLSGESVPTVVMESRDHQRAVVHGRGPGTTCAGAVGEDGGPSTWGQDAGQVRIPNIR